MSHLFLSYKSEDAQRVAPLAQALQRCDLNVWWDRYLPGGESWHAQIQSALENAQCVVAIWTHASVGPAGDFVRDEARYAKQRNILVPVQLDRVPPPLGFGEIQSIDLTRWKGSPSDPFFQDLVAAVKAKMEGRPAPPAKGPLRRLERGRPALQPGRCSSAKGAKGDAVVLARYGCVGFSEVMQPINAACRCVPHEQDGIGAVFHPGKQEQMVGAEVEHRGEDLSAGAEAPAPIVSAVEGLLCGLLQSGISSQRSSSSSGDQCGWQSVVSAGGGGIEAGAPVGTPLPVWHQPLP